MFVLEITRLSQEIHKDAFAQGIFIGFVCLTVSPSSSSVDVRKTAPLSIDDADGSFFRGNHSRDTMKYLCYSPRGILSSRLCH